MAREILYLRNEAQKLKLKNSIERARKEEWGTTEVSRFISTHTYVWLCIYIHTSMYVRYLSTGMSTMDGTRTHNHKKKFELMNDVDQSSLIVYQTQNN
jgi:hypothetical protein